MQSPYCLAFQLAGASYMEVHSAGGGINFTVDHTRSASEKELETLLLPRLERMIKAGECDSEPEIARQRESLQRLSTRVNKAYKSFLCKHNVRFQLYYSLLMYNFWIFHGRSSSPLC